MSDLQKSIVRFTPLEIPISNRGRTKFLTGFTIFIFLIIVLYPIAEVRAGSIFDFFRKNKEVTASNKAEEKDVRGTATEEEPTTLPQVYIVKEGDSLSGIARRFYGDVSKWTLIYEANKDKIKDPNRIKPGIGLTIPAPQKEKAEVSQVESLEEGRREQGETAKRAEEERLRKEAEKKEKLAQVESAYKEEEKVPVQKEKVPVQKEEVSVQKEEVSVSEDVIKEEPRVFEYTISEADVLYILIWQEETLSQEVIVRPDGKISFPLAGDVPAAGLTFTQLKEELTKRLKDYIKYPVVSISLKKLGGKKVIVLGEVGSAGVYSVTGKSTILEAIGCAGGFTPHAVPSSTILIRGGLQNPKGMRLNLTRAIDRADMNQNVVLQSEDIIYVPKKFIANVNYALTQILGPISQGVYTANTARNW